MSPQPPLPRTRRPSPGHSASRRRFVLDKSNRVWPSYCPIRLQNRPKRHRKARRDQRRPEQSNPESLRAASARVGRLLSENHCLANSCSNSPVELFHESEGEVTAMTWPLSKWVAT